MLYVPPNIINKAYILKLVWRLFINKAYILKSIWCRVLKGKYFPKDNFINGP